MSQQQYNQILSNLLKEKQALVLLRAQLEEKKKREYWNYRKFRHLDHDYRIKTEKRVEKRGKTPK